MNRFRKFLGVVAVLSALLLSSRPAGATDIQIYPTGPSFSLKSLVWGTATQPGFNNNYFFVPATNLNGSVCIYVENNNPTNAHPFTVSISVTSDPDETTPSNGTWQTAAQTTATAGASPGFPAGIGANISGTALVSINFSGSTTLGGAPDTADVNIVQTTGNCFSGNNSTGSAPSTVSAVPAVQAISEGLSQSFYSQFGVTNPASGQLVLYVQPNNGQRSLYFDKIILSSSVAIQINFGEANAPGVGCGAGSAPTNQKITSAVTSTATVQTGICATSNPVPLGPTIGTFLAAGASQTVDLRGFIGLQGTNGGITVTSNAATGTISATLFWYEK
jgi:hypothetical protein